MNRTIYIFILIVMLVIMMIINTLQASAMMMPSTDPIFGTTTWKDREEARKQHWEVSNTVLELGVRDTRPIRHMRSSSLIRCSVNAHSGGRSPASGSAA